MIAIERDSGVRSNTRGRRGLGLFDAAKMIAGQIAGGIGSIRMAMASRAARSQLGSRGRARLPRNASSAPESPLLRPA
ncbi:hypothetical protein AL036_05340 [Salipiger aestuarii]|nr:hypothetical protein C357_09009 [Citreicella sp. 357]KAA8609136.1 hypothetical protein AL036_05340 [Salipiger aestuarii]KAB2542826.1 hypothetical protein AL035_05615 [Salipiger aestuarii]